MRRILGRLTLIISLTVASLGLIAATGEAAPNDRFIFTPTADTYVDQALPNDSFGGAQELWVRAGSPGRAKQTLLRFEVPAFNKRRLLDVRLRMFQTDPTGSDAGGRVRGPISGGWDESTTWNTRPSIAKAIRGKFGAVKGGHTYEISLGASWISGSGGPVNLGMDSTSKNMSRWGSNEHHTPPQLILILRPRSYPTNVDKFTFNPVLDTYVDQSQPGSSFGNLPSMWVDNNPTKQAFLRFHIEGLASPKSRTIVDVRLRIFQVDASPQGGRVFQITDDSWNESTTWATRPPIDGPQRNSFASVAKGHWYELDLSRYVLPNNSDQDLNLAIDSVNGDGARWASRESANAPKLIVSVARIPGFILDGLSVVAGASQGSTEPTFFASQHHMAKTAGGRLLAVYGRHASGLQLAWRDPGGGWQTDTTGTVRDGHLLGGGGTGRWPASIVVAKDSRGVQHAWVVWGRPSPFSFKNGIGMRRLSNLDSRSGPKVGRAITVASAGLGTAVPDISIEVAGTSRRGVIVWTRNIGSGRWAIQTKWFTNLGTDAPKFVRPKTLLSGGGKSRGGSLVPSRYGMRLVLRNIGGTGGIRFFGHNLGKPLDSWWSRGPGNVPLTQDSRVAGVAFSSGALAATAESDTTNHVVIVQTFSKGGYFRHTLLTTDPGYAQPVLASDGTNLYLVMVKVSDMSVVARKWNGSTWTVDKAVISSSDCGANCSWPNLIRGTDGRLRLVVGGPNGNDTENAVLAFQRRLVVLFP